MTRAALLHWVAGIVATAVVMAGLARASVVSVAMRDADAAGLRLSWSARPQRIEVCRELTAAEQAEREEHMRQRVLCDGQFATYTLRVEVNGRTLEESVVRGGGLRHDRPIHLLREFTMTPGMSRLRISMVRIEASTDSSGEHAARPRSESESGDTGIFAGRAEREGIERERRRRAAMPSRLVLDTTLALESGRVVLVTFDQERGMLRARKTGTVQ